MATKSKMGRPRFVVNWQIVDKLCFIQCTELEIVSCLECSVDTINRACKREKKKTFAEYRSQKAEGGKHSLRRMQFEAAKKGSGAMLIWLGKQYLGQRERSELTGANGEPLFGQPGREELIDRAIARMINNGVPADQTLGAVRALLGNNSAPVEQAGNETLGTIQ